MLNRLKLMTLPLREGRFSAYWMGGYASGGPFFSALPEKKGEKRGAWLRLVRAAGAIQASPDF